MKVLTSKQMRNLDNRAIQEFGIPGSILMENAGLGITQEIEKKFPEIHKENVVIVAGKGNNGGDGFVVARHLFNRGCKPCVLLFASKKNVKGDAGLNLSIADKMGIPIKEIPSVEAWEKERGRIFHASLLVDAIFGTGLFEPAKGLHAQVIEDINRSHAFKVAIDIPSGLSSDNFQIIGPCVKANLTVTMAAPKVAHVFPPSEEYVGKWVVVDISIPSFLFEDEAIGLEIIERSRVQTCFLPRGKDTHKGTFGHLFVLSGALGKTGAAVLAGKAALKMGAGLVTVGTPQSCLPIIARSMPELMTEPLPETSSRTLSVEAMEDIQILLKGKDAVLIGPGISTHESTTELVLSLLPQLKIPVVLDADALNIVSEKPEVLKKMSHPVILTPHPGEFARVLHASTKTVLKEKLTLAPQLAQDYGVYLILKGYKTLVACPDGRVYINPTGNPGMATAGSGDVLSGMIAAMMMQESSLVDALLASVYVHGLSGDIAAERVGEKSLTAGNLIARLPSAIKTLMVP